MPGEGACDPETTSPLRRMWVTLKEQRSAKPVSTAPRIDLILTDDWEVRGDGSGNARAIQFDTMRTLCDVYERHGLQASFNVEVLQQLAHLRLGDQHPELREIAAGWEAIVRETYSRGHDIQLHVHPQWSDAAYTDGLWSLRGAWSLLEYPADQAKAMLESAKEYLEGLLQPINPSYRCISFRSGSWCIAPSEHLLGILADLGILVNMSIVDGLFYEAPHVTIDYRNIDEPFLPYYPTMGDARRVGTTPQPIVCIPTHSFHARLPGFGLRLVARTLDRRTSLGRPLTCRFVAPRDTAIPNAGYERAAYFREEWGNEPMDGMAKRRTKVSDLCGLSYYQMSEMLRDIRRRAKSAGAGAIPVILQNHTKDVGDFAPLQLFAKRVGAARDLRVITLAELATRIAAGDYLIRRART